MFGEVWHACKQYFISENYVNGILLLCFMSDVLCWFANREHLHLKIEFCKNKKTLLKVATILFEALVYMFGAYSYYAA